MARFLAQLALTLCVLTQVFGQIHFTGDSKKDFKITDPADKRNITLVQIINKSVIYGTDYMNQQGLKSGFDLENLFIQYDWINDELNGAFDCAAICGDADGDGDPDSWNTPGADKNTDYPDQTGTEWTTMGIQTNTPADYNPELNPPGMKYLGYYPDMGVGDSYGGGLTPCLTEECDEVDYGFSAWKVMPDTWCDNLVGGAENPQCEANRASKCNKFPNTFVYSIPHQSRLPIPGNPDRVVENVQIYTPLNNTWQDIEFRVRNFSQYGSFNFRKGIDPIRFAFHVSIGSESDASQEDNSVPALLTIPCIIKDECGDCNGNNSKCADCRNIPNGGWVTDLCDRCVPPSDFKFRDSCGECVYEHEYNRAKDACEVCFGDNSTCSDCLGTPYGNATYDNCGVCDGGDLDMDLCGECYGNNTCLDCTGTPFGSLVVDDCKICGGLNMDKDECGECFGDNHTCADCAGIPNGNSSYDECGICNGDGSFCADCAGVPNGDWMVDNCSRCAAPDDQKWIDLCGDCDGGDNACRDCAGVPNGPHFTDHCKRCRDYESGEVFDLCNICGGDNSTCTDCAGAKWLPNKIGNAFIDDCQNCILYGEQVTPRDYCGVCNGNNETLDVCGECDGFNNTCDDCMGIPNGGHVYDNCGVCGGDNTTCDCWLRPNITINAADTWIDLRNRSNNYGRDVDLWVSSDKQRTLLRFDDIRFQINGATEQRPEILSATLRLFVRGEIMLGSEHMGWYEDGQVSVHVLDNNFCEDKATWECRDYDSTGCCVQWRMLALYPKVKADYEFEPVAKVDVFELEGHRGWVDFDLTEDIKSFMAHGFLNSRSYLVKKECETDWGWIKFWSCDSANHMNCPHLYIKLLARCFPEKPIPEPEPEKC